ncbi:MAG TPA: cupin domain-containing protein [Dehalococcoidia bacterium]|nr:cupin domain-containing protein [Dehalococcoidia bacterium]
MSNTYRMYTDTQGIARWEEIDLAKNPQWLAGMDVTKVKFGLRPPGAVQDWHPAPQRQFVFILSGSLEIGFEDGSKKVFGPGDARLVEDITGKGHTTIALGNEPCVTATVGLKDQTAKN